MAAPFLRWQLPDSQIRLRLLHLNVYQLNLLQRKDLHILSFSRMENYPTRFVSTRFVSIRGHQFFCYPSYQKWQSDNPLQMDCAKKTASCFIGAYLPNVCWTVTNWAQASVSLNRRPSQRSQINSLHDISGRTLRSTVRIIPPNGEKKKKTAENPWYEATRIKKALLIWIFKFHVWLLNLHEHLGGGKSCAWKLRWGF